MTQKVEISSKTVVFTVFFLLFLRVLWITRELIFALFLAFIFMSALKPVVYFLERRKLHHTFSVVFVFLSTLIALFFMFAVVFPPLIPQSIAFVKSFPTLITRVFPTLSFYLNLESLNRLLPDITQNFFKVITGVFSNFIFVVSVMFFTFYFLLEERFLKNFLDKFLEKKQVEGIAIIIERAEKRLGAWVRGELLLMTIIGLMSYIGLTLLGIPYALPLAIMAGVLEIIPIIGPVISAIPAFFVASSISWTMGLAVIGLYILVQQLENNVIVPVVMKRAVGINPILTLIALTVGGKLGGFLGILLAVPVALFVETVLMEASRIHK